MPAAPNASIFVCALNTIVSNVRQRVGLRSGNESDPVTPLALTGPTMLHGCYE